MEFLPELLLRTAPPLPGAPPSKLTLPLLEAIGPKGEPVLHVDITYGNAPLNAAGQLVGGTGRDGNGSDVFGDDDRIMGGEITIIPAKVDPVSGAMMGEVRWIPHVHVKDTVDFCPGNMGGLGAQMVTVELSRLEKSGIAKDVPITVDFDLPSRGVASATSCRGSSPPRRSRRRGPSAGRSTRSSAAER